MGAKHSNASEPQQSQSSVRPKENKKGDNLLTPHQKRLLRQAWKHMNRNLGNMVFKRMVSKDPAIARVFQRATAEQGVLKLSTTPISAQQHHSAIFFDLLALAMSDLDSLNVLGTRCFEYGAKHAQYEEFGFKLEHWDSFGEAMTESAREFEGWRTHREALRAWTRLISLMVDRLRAGHQQGLRKNTQKNENESLVRSGDISSDPPSRVNRGFMSQPSLGNATPPPISRQSTQMQIDYANTSQHK